jgi:hypothetical protein
MSRRMPMILLLDQTLDRRRRHDKTTGSLPERFSEHPSLYSMQKSTRVFWILIGK